VLVLFSPFFFLAQHSTAHARHSPCPPVGQGELRDSQGSFAFFFLPKAIKVLLLKKEKETFVRLKKHIKRPGSFAFKK
jgi:hypothetical protein